ncbi:lipopolysaccharide-induced tumor necrosis factor-alpha factor homolog [Condylostylus longicornis]|uniref:lipopolysaccharide-induced tumor necrosis factor-alpha factor homolog n=1 Tax=Condylostylus longicornis TaxID=2530218 RepID=UPI00244DC63C|nr:lipopolysaccharide-induced tumor necrosis factor-alpha factor homolog [Condylostylus longicornis]XP_055374521.1 lipopolysaccharide-induced tumor necrosis factor-alpha factor homolog [Condylostylus longicornis]XP_055374522.1 lipopolysaccharide-induced tumor necrosis factor-alpha factor homolog [Condylostylus longicornis]
MCPPAYPIEIIPIVHYNYSNFDPSAPPLTPSFTPSLTPPPSYEESENHYFSSTENEKEKFLIPSYEESQREYYSSMKNKSTHFVLKHGSKTEFGPKPQMANCTYCGKSGITVVKHKIGPKTNIAALLMFLSGLWCFCLMPYYVNSLKYGLHHCTHCEHFLGTYDR